MFKNLPNHIAIIMDGNNRWANARGLNSYFGHKQGAEAVKSLISAIIRLNIPNLTLYAFSSENWQRPKDEITSLMKLLKLYLQLEIDNLHKENIKLNIIGNKSLLSDDIRTEITKAEELTKNNSGLNLTIAFNYGSRKEIIDAVREIIIDIDLKKLDIDNLSEDIFRNYLYTKSLPDPDLLIRTSGEQRISNFLLWQLAYTEFFFTKTLWPDFSEKDLNEAIMAYQSRERRYGKR